MIEHEPGCTPEWKKVFHEMAKALLTKKKDEELNAND